MVWRFVVVAMIGGCTTRQITIRTPPFVGAYVFRDGQLVGRTPITVDADRTLEVFLPGFSPYTIEGGMLEAIQLDVALAGVSPALPRVDHHPAWILTKAAIDAGRAGDCDAVKMIAAEVQRDDASLHDVVFVHEIAIARCLATR